VRQTKLVISSAFQRT